jgi:hypothetical protein
MTDTVTLPADWREQVRTNYQRGFTGGPDAIIELIDVHWRTGTAPADPPDRWLGLTAASVVITRDTRPMVGTQAEWECWFSYGQPRSMVRTLIPCPRGLFGEVAVGQRTADIYDAMIKAVANLTADDLARLTAPPVRVPNADGPRSPERLRVTATTPPSASVLVGSHLIVIGAAPLLDAVAHLVGIGDDGVTVLRGVAVRRGKAYPPAPPPRFISLAVVHLLPAQNTIYDRDIEQAG